MRTLSSFSDRMIYGQSWPSMCLFIEPRASSILLSPGLVPQALGSRLHYIPLLAAFLRFYFSLRDRSHESYILRPLSVYSSFMLSAVFLPPPKYYCILIPGSPPCTVTPHSPHTHITSPRVPSVPPISLSPFPFLLSPPHSPTTPHDTHCKDRNRHRVLPPRGRVQGSVLLRQRTYILWYTPGLHWSVPSSLDISTRTAFAMLECMTSIFSCFSFLCCQCVFPCRYPNRPFLHGSYLSSSHIAHSIHKYPVSSLSCCPVSSR